jgi:hypothetical protein
MSTLVLTPWTFSKPNLYCSENKCTTNTNPEFAECAKGRTFSLSWACKAQQFAMNSCMIAHAGPAAEDAAREEWFVGVEQRRRKKEEEAVAVEERRKQVIEMTRRQEEKEKMELEAKKNKQEGPVKGKSGWFQ